MIQTKTWWMTGLSGAGKSTLAQAFAIELRRKGLAVCVLDGDELRRGLSSDLGFSAADREEQCRRAAELATILNANGIFVIAALISPTQSSRLQARRIIGEDAMCEVYISTPLHVCQQRDVKGLYAKARLQQGMQLTGVQSPYEIPSNPDISINTDQNSLEQAIQILLSQTSNLTV